jgi:hypothetical protein
MNTAIELVNLESEAHRIVTLVYPEDLELVPEGVSVLPPLGIARIGSQDGDVVRYPEREPACWFRVAKIVYQPERAGAWQLLRKLAASLNVAYRGVGRVNAIYTHFPKWVEAGGCGSGRHA